MDCILLQSDLDVLSSWSANWKLMFNETKCSLLSIVTCASTEQNDYQYLINNRPIPWLAKRSWHHSFFMLIYLGPTTIKHPKLISLLRRTFCSSNNKEAAVNLSCKITAPLWVTNFETSPVQRHQPNRVTSRSCNQIDTEWLQLQLQIQINQTLSLTALNATWAQWHLLICWIIKTQFIQQFFKLNMSPSATIKPDQWATWQNVVQPLIKHNRDKHFYFNRLLYLWNSLPPIDLSLTFDSIKKNWKTSFGNHFWPNSTLATAVGTISPAHAQVVSPSLNHVLLIHPTTTHCLQTCIELKWCIMY